MDKFSTLDLSAHFNVTRDNEPPEPGLPPPWLPEIAPAIQSLPGGTQTFWGVPFELGPAESNTPCWLLLGWEQSGRFANRPYSIPLSGTASFVVITHFCNASPDPDRPDVGVGFATRPGEHLADYVLCYEDGSEHRQPIRRRFEINEPTISWGQLAFAARPHQADAPLDFRGPAERNQWGEFQTSVSQGAYATPCRYWIYALENPRPEKGLKALRIEPTGADRLAITGLTLYHGREHPLRHRRLETLRVMLEEAVDPEQVEAAIDLGIIARQYAVPAFAPEEWLGAELVGWGEEAKEGEGSRELLLDVTASPEATLTVAGHEVNMGEVCEKGRAQSADGRALVEILTPRKAWVHVTVEDASTGRPTPVRVHFRAPDGRYLPPYGHRHEVNDNWFEDYGADLKLGSTQYAYVDGRFQIELPVGEVYVELAKGFEYQPLRRKLHIEPGQRELRLKIRQAMDLRREGWVTADTHVHFISPQTAWLEAQAEGLNLVNLLASQWGDLFTNVGDITGEVSGVSRDDTLIWVGTENRQHLLGHMSLLGSKGNPVFPMCAGGPSESYLGDPAWTSLAEWADACRKREGVVVMPHFPNPYCEVVADIVLGKVDAVEIRTFGPTLSDFGTTEWYRFLNCGYRVAAVGGTDKMSAGMPVGGVRTYAQLRDEDFTFESWARAVRAGRTFTTSGPILGFRVEGRSPGEDIQLPAGGGTLEVEAWAQSVQPFHELQVVANGRVVARKETTEGTTRTRLSAQVRLRGSGWLAARCVSRLKVWHVWPVHIAAHTSPVYVVAGGEELFSPSDAAYMLTLLDGGLTWLDTLSIPASPEKHQRIREVFHHAQQHLQGRLHERGH